MHRPAVGHRLPEKLGAGQSLQPAAQDSPRFFLGKSQPFGALPLGAQRVTGRQRDFLRFRPFPICPEPVEWVADFSTGQGLGDRFIWICSESCLELLTFQAGKIFQQGAVEEDVAAPHAAQQPACGHLV
jgi:hypothetical protein